MSTVVLLYRKMLIMFFCHFIAKVYDIIQLDKRKSIIKLIWLSHDLH